jgi:myo-inositol-1(or 4)-monophosphatase
MRALQERLETAVALATEAGALAMQMRAASTATLKGPQDWVTQADGAVESFLSDRLAAAFPADGFQGEERGILRSGTLRWVVDPIDGTANYMRDLGRFCVSVACLEDRTPLIGVIVAPALGETYVARQGSGAMLNGTPIHAAETTALDRSVIEVGWSHRRSNQDFLALCEKLLTQGATLRHGGSGALGLAEVAAGRMDGYVELHINLWDVAAALVLLAEAGAAVSPFLESNGPTDGNPILACAPGVAGGLAALDLLHGMGEVAVRERRG